MSKEEENLSQLSSLIDLNDKNGKMQGPYQSGFSQSWKKFELFESLISTNLQKNNMFDFQFSLNQYSSEMDEIDILQCPEETMIKSTSKQSKKQTRELGGDNEISDDEYVESEQGEQKKERLSKNRKKKIIRRARGDTKNLLINVKCMLLKYFKQNCAKAPAIFEKTYLNHENLKALAIHPQFAQTFRQILHSRYLHRAIIMSRLPPRTKMFYIKKVSILANDLLQSSRLENS